jgi:hypothetical protein
MRLDRSKTEMLSPSTLSPSTPPPPPSLLETTRKTIGISVYWPNAITVTFSTGSSLCTSDGSNVATATFKTDLGDLPLMTADVTSLGSGTVSVAETVTGSYENVECGNQGFCNTDKGICNCVDGFDSSDGSGASGERGDCGFKLSYITYDLKL